MDLRKIDALVAEHVYEWTWRDPKSTGLSEIRGTAVDAEGRCLLPPETPEPSGRGWQEWFVGMPCYSEDIVAALEVAEVVRSHRGCNFFLVAIDRAGNPPDWEAEFRDWIGSSFDAIAWSAPLAISLAALKAKGVEVE